MKRIFTALITLCLFNIGFAQAPANDNCAGAIALPITPIGGACPTTIYTNVNANDAVAGQNAPCFNGQLSFNDVWFAFTTGSGSDLNYRISIKGVNAADSIRNPQVAIYLGDCVAGLNLQYCQSKTVAYDTSGISIDAGCMLPNTTYYIQVASYLSTDVGGRFNICVQPLDAVYQMTAVPQTTTACNGILYDSGGPNNNYTANENRTFIIAPAVAGCGMEITIDSFAMEANIDSLAIFDDLTGVLLDRITHTNNTDVIRFQVQTSRVRILFRSNGTTHQRGFRLSWRNLFICDAPKPTYCERPGYPAEPIATVPFSYRGTTCNDDLRAVTTSPCTPATRNDFLQGKDHVFKFTSQGGQCVRVSLSGFPVVAGGTGANVGIYRGCPGAAMSECIATGTLNTARDSVIIASASLNLPGDYYFVVSRREACMSFTLKIDSIPCLNILPNAGFCDRMLPLNGSCTPANPSNVLVDLGQQGDPNFYEAGATHMGCISGLGGVNRFNFVFLRFKAGATGKFAFSVKPLAGTPDIDFAAYGPFTTEASICQTIKNNPPLRCSWAAGRADVGYATGMADTFRRIDGTLVNVTDVTEGAGGDAFVRAIDVIKDRFYVIWINDFSGTIGSTGVTLNFGGTTAGVLNGTPQDTVTITKDTTLCAGASVQLRATGGLVYTWDNQNTLSSTTIPNPIATPARSTTYSVAIQATCQVYGRSVRVNTLNINPLPNLSTCDGGELRINAGESYPSAVGAVWTWSSPTGHLSELSCTDCPTPTIRVANSTGLTETHTFTVRLQGPPNCDVTRTFNVTVSPEAIAQYRVATAARPTRDTSICVGSSFNLLESFDNTATYTWTSSPTEILTGQNPLVAPTVTTRYYVSVAGGSGGCSLTSRDSVLVRVYSKPVLRGANDTTLCYELPYVLGRTVPESEVTYTWTSPAGTTGLSATNVPNPTLTVRAGSLQYLLTATNPGGCVTRDTVNVTGIALSMAVVQNDSVRICRGDSVILSVVGALNGISPLSVKWSSNRDFTARDSANTIVVRPERRAKYYAFVGSGSCIRRDSMEVFVDSLPANRMILPADTTVCENAIVLFRSPVFDPVLFPGASFKWTNPYGNLTPDSLYNMAVSADSTRFYYRVARNGVCRVTDSVHINVNLIPRITIRPVDTVLCNALNGVNTVTLTASTPTTGTTGWEWTGPQGRITSADGRTVVTVNPTIGTGIYTVKAKNGDCPGQASTTIRVKPLPTISFPSNTIVCPGSSIVLNASPVPTYTYNWSIPSTAAAPSVSPAATTRYTVRVTLDGCSIDSAVTVFVPVASLNVTPDSIAVCQGLPATFTAAGTTSLGDPFTYRWNTGATGATFSPPTNVSATYTVTGTYGRNCTLTKNAKLFVIPGFNVRITPDTFNNVLVDQGTPLTLTAQLSGNISRPTIGWTDNNRGFATTQQVSVTPLEDTHIYSVYVQAETGCRKDTTITVNVRFPNFDIANAFTPNGDAINGTFGPIFNGTSFDPNDPRPRFWKGRIVFETFQVFNRWGQAVYNVSDQAVLNANGYQGWDGKLSNGAEAASDVYVYVIKLRMPTGEVKTLSGELNLVR